MFHSAARRESQLTNTFTCVSKINKMSDLTISEKRELSDKIMLVLKETHIEELDIVTVQTFFCYRCGTLN
jgi:hypothetical protein